MKNTKEKMVAKLQLIFDVLDNDEAGILNSSFCTKDFKNKFCDFKDEVYEEMRSLDAEIFYEQEEEEIKKLAKEVH